ncbi:phage protein [Candidatus Magnetobacterium bavaricum]|uniref:Phage protein n=1 Tax=Candidatus Magnetobacterium bavaricum TaxID=29290 RepID=A0A0F3GK17_9BACT|nr:phage protein [Candidatus Magnetobacterium bavaricum]
MTTQSNLPTTISFHQDTLIAIEKDGKVYVAMKPICEVLGLNWYSHNLKISIIYFIMATYAY